MSDNASHRFIIATLVSIFISGCSDHQSESKASSQSSQRQQINLINPGFESSATSAKGWTLTQHTGDAAYTATIDTQYFAEGKQSIKITRTNEQQWGMLSQYIKLPGAVGKKITLSAMVKTGAVGNKGFQFALHFRKNNSKLILDTKSTLQSGNTDWKKIEFSTLVPEKTAILQIAAILLDEGSVWIDDIQLSIEK